jgi:hypothetical protein
MKIRNKQTGQIIEVTEDQLADYGLDTMAKGGMIKRADGSYSRRGLWDNIRANKGSGKKPTKAMLAQERKIRAAEKAYGGYMDMGGYMNPYMAYGGYLPMAQDGIGMVRPSAAEIAQRSQSYAPVQETSMLQPVVIEDDSQPYSVIQRTLPEGVDYSSQVPFNMGVVQVGNVPVQVAMKQEAAKPAKSTSKNLGLVDYLASQGLAFDKESRKKYAKELGIKDYDFSATKNTELLKKIKEQETKLNKYNSFAARSFSQPYFERDTYQEAAASPNVQQPNVGKYNSFTARSFNQPVMVEEQSYSPAPKSTPAPVRQPVSRYNAFTSRSFAQPFFDQDVAVPQTFTPGNVVSILTNPAYKPTRANGGGINNPGFRALPDYVQEKIKDNMAYGGCKECGGRMEAGGKLPKEVLRARLESHMSSGQAQDYLNTYGMGGYLEEAGDGKWIQKATASIKRRGTEGVCTGSKFGGPGCPPGSKRYNLAKTFRKMAKSKKEEGGYAQGGEYEMTDAEIAKLRSMGYKIKEV